MHSPRRNRFVAFLAVAALLVATSAYLAHGYGDAGSHSNVQCDLCLQFNGTAGTPSLGGLVGKPPLVGLVPRAFASPFLTARRKVGSQLPRAPPADSLI